MIRAMRQFWVKSYIVHTNDISLIQHYILRFKNARNTLVTSESKTEISRLLHAKRDL